MRVPMKEVEEMPRAAANKSRRWEAQVFLMPFSPSKLLITCYTEKLCQLQKSFLQNHRPFTY
jgi:hypothetical protein